MRVLRSADFKRMPWKNGGGTTTEIAVHPPSAGLADFDWRISMAHVSSDGPFSSFPGVDRSLSILEGEGLTLSIEGRDPVGMTRLFEPLVFPADVPTSARLISGPITDLNVMTRRGVYSSDVRRVEFSAKQPVGAADRTMILMIVGGGLTAGEGREAVVLRPGDAFAVEPGETALVQAMPACNALLIEITAAQPG